MHADIDPGAADRLTRGVHARNVPELGQAHQRGQLPDPVDAHERLAPGLTASDRFQVALDPRDLDLQQVDHLQGDQDSLASVSSEVQGTQELSTSEGAQIRGRAGDPVVIEHRADPLLPRRAVIGQRLSQPGA